MDTYNAILGSSPINLVQNNCPSFDDMIKWDVGSISSEFVLWMTDDHAQPGSTSLVGILSSSAFENMISKFVGENLSKHLRLFVKSTSFLYSRGSQTSDADCDSTSWWSLRSLAGCRVLLELELALGIAFLATVSLEKLTALFLVQFATIIAVGYFEPRGPLGGLSGSTFELPVYQSQTSVESSASRLSAQAFSGAQSHLLRILTHHMVYIAERINLLEPKISRKRIIEGSACRWNRRAMFQCNKMPNLQDVDIHNDLLSSYDTQGKSRKADHALRTEYPARCYHLSRSHTAKSYCTLAGGFGTCAHEQSLNIEPSPMDQILANLQQTTLLPLDEEAQIEGTNNPRLDLDGIQQAPHSTDRRSSPTSRLPSLSARDKNYAAFECLAETDVMRAPFICTDADDDDDTATTTETDPTSALTTSSPSTLKNSDQSDTCDGHRSEQRRSVCRACRFATLPFETLDQDGLCQFCSALPLGGDDGDVDAPHPPLSIYPLSPSDDLVDQEVLERVRGKEEEHGYGKLLV